MIDFLALKTFLQAVSDREPYLIEWQVRVKSDLELLQEHGLSVDEDSIMTTLDQLMAALFEIPSNPVHRRVHSVQPELGLGRFPKGRAWLNRGFDDIKGFAHGFSS